MKCLWLLLSLAACGRTSLPSSSSSIDDDTSEDASDAAPGEATNCVATANVSVVCHDGLSWFLDDCGASDVLAEDCGERGCADGVCSSELAIAVERPGHSRVGRAPRVAIGDAVITLAYAKAEEILVETYALTTSTWFDDAVPFVASETADYDVVWRGAELVLAVQDGLATTIFSSDGLGGAWSEESAQPAMSAPDGAYTLDYTGVRIGRLGDGVGMARMYSATSTDDGGFPARSESFTVPETLRPRYFSGAEAQGPVVHDQIDATSFGTTMATMSSFGGIASVWVFDATRAESAFYSDGSLTMGSAGIGAYSDATFFIASASAELLTGVRSGVFDLESTTGSMTWTPQAEPETIDGDAGLVVAMQDDAPLMAIATPADAPVLSFRTIQAGTMAWSPVSGYPGLTIAPIGARHPDLDAKDDVICLVWEQGDEPLIAMSCSAVVR